MIRHRSDVSGLSGTEEIHCNLLVSFGSIFEDKLVDVKFPLTSLVVHVADLPEDVPLSPCPVVNATDAPHDAKMVPKTLKNDPKIL